MLVQRLLSWPDSHRRFPCPPFPSPPQVRVSLDCQLRMSAVDGSHVRTGKSFLALPESHDTRIEFPYSILEIKLADDQPEWVSRLLSSGMVIEVAAFSKYLHSVPGLRGGWGVPMVCSPVASAPAIQGHQSPLRKWQP